MKREPNNHEQEIIAQSRRQAGAPKDETLPRPPKRPLRKLWGSILFVLSLGFWKGN